MRRYDAPGGEEVDDNKAVGVGSLVEDGIPLVLAVDGDDIAGGFRHALLLRGRREELVSDEHEDERQNWVRHDPALEFDKHVDGWLDQQVGIRVMDHHIGVDLVALWGRRLFGRRLLSTKPETPQIREGLRRLSRWRRSELGSCWCAWARRRHSWWSLAEWSRGTDAGRDGATITLRR